jgi:hypothetical protein
MQRATIPRFSEGTDNANAWLAHLLNHLVGNGEYPRRNGEAERPGSL